MAGVYFFIKIFIQFYFVFSAIPTIIFIRKYCKTQVSKPKSHQVSKPEESIRKQEPTRELLQEFQDHFQDYTEGTVVQNTNKNIDFNPKFHFRCSLDSKNFNESDYIVNTQDLCVIAPKEAREIFVSAITNSLFSVYCELNIYLKSDLSIWDLTDATKRILECPNAGGDSAYSEALSYEILYQGFQAELIATETEIMYFGPEAKKTDYLCKIDDTLVAVSVTRAMKYGDDVYTMDDAVKLLKKKLKAVLKSNLDVIGPHCWKKQILHVWASNAEIAQMYQNAYTEYISDTLKANTLVLITVSNLDIVFQKTR